MNKNYYKLVLPLLILTLAAMLVDKIWFITLTATTLLIYLLFVKNKPLNNLQKIVYSIFVFIIFASIRIALVSFMFFNIDDVQLKTYDQNFNDDVVKYSLSLNIDNLLPYKSNVVSETNKVNNNADHILIFYKYGCPVCDYTHKYIQKRIEKNGYQDNVYFANVETKNGRKLYDQYKLDHSFYIVYVKRDGTYKVTPQVLFDNNNNFSFNEKVYSELDKIK